MAEFVPLGEQIEMEDVLAEPTADRVRIVHCIIHQYSGTTVSGILVLIPGPIFY